MSVAYTGATLQWDSVYSIPRDESPGYCHRSLRDQGRQVWVVRLGVYEYGVGGLVSSCCFVFVTKPATTGVGLKLFIGRL